MHNSFFFLRLLSRQLHAEVTGFHITAAFSQSKDELIIELTKGVEVRFIRAFFSQTFCCLSFPREFSRARRNSIDLFRLTFGKVIEEVIQVDNDRSFYFQLSHGNTLLFKMHGNRANIILYEGDKPIELFRNNLKQDTSLDLNKLAKKVDFSAALLESHEGNYKRCLPTFGTAFDEFLEKRNYWSVSNSERARLIYELLEYLQSPEIYIHHQSGQLPRLLLLRQSDEDSVQPTPIDALNALFRQYSTVYLAREEKNRQTKTIQSQIDKTKEFIEELNAKVLELQNTASYSHIGDLIMANLQHITPYSASITLSDFYSNSPVEIRLRAEISPQHNAERYYKKAKKQQIEIDHLKETINARKFQLAELKERINLLERTESKKELRKAVESTLESSQQVYHLVRYMGYDILIGKNAVKNEQLTFHVATKNDLFLHAKDAAGSHVIVRNKAGQNIPKPVLEKAAAYAAYYSKSKNEPLARVAYTLKKHVRKAKGMPAGSVIVEKERTVLVKPEAIKK